MIGQSKSIELYIIELQQAATTASLNYEIWWAYKDQDERLKYTDTMNRYSLFFQTSIHAHFAALLFVLYRLYEKRKNTFNVHSLLVLVRQEDHLPEVVMHRLDNIHAAVKPLWIKVSILRNKAFGHRSVTHTTGEVFEEAAITPDEIKTIIELTKELLNELTLAWNRSTHAFNLNPRKDIIRGLEDLKKYSEWRLKSK